ncbi:MAG: EamA family transporter RarD [Caldilineaceae bacterium]
MRLLKTPTRYHDLRNDEPRDSLCPGRLSLLGPIAAFLESTPRAAPLEILAHRVVWSVLFLLALLTVRRQWQWIRQVSRDRRVLLTFAATSVLLSVNWLTYIWAVNAGYVLESSLGYFINPLVNVVLGVVILGERMRWGQWAAVTLAAAGVIYLTVTLGTVPWIALTLALTFSVYALVRKTASLNSLEGLMVETAFMLIPALGYLFYLEWQGRGTFGHLAITHSVLLFATGVVTALPLLLLLPVLTHSRFPDRPAQYTSPTIQFLLAIFLYHEPFSTTRLAGFVLIWTALAVYSGESLWQRRQLNTLEPVKAG